MTDVNKIKENNDGSATYTFDFTEEEQLALFRAGVIQAIKAGVKEAKQYDPEKESKTYTRSVELTWDQIDSIVVEELQAAYRHNMTSDTDEGGQELEVDENLLTALSTVLEYFMPAHEYNEWRLKYERL